MKHCFTIILLIINFLVYSQEKISLDYYLPGDISYNPNIPTPQSVLGYVPGKWHVTHDKLIQYMTALAKASPRVHLENRGHTYEDRPLILLTITAEKNQQQLSKIQKEHRQLTEKNAYSLAIENMPAVVYQGFSIHGNEPSGTNAALLVAYYLAAGEGEKINQLLDNVVVLFDPALNPDGIQRFAYWANTNKSKNISTDPQDREYSEIWPGGRTNHYWFDMNRDWLPVQLPESKARIHTFHQWYPNILTDHHEMGPNSTFFFQPGVQSRTHPLTPKLNQELTKKIGNFHANALDKIGSLYFTEENFDDFYYGKGSTFPDINGGVGILFEQGSSRGHAQKTQNGILTFPFTIRNQFITALSTLEAAKSMRKELLAYQRDFYNDIRKTKNNQSYVFGSEKDAASAYHLAEILKRHQVKIYDVKNDFSSKGKAYKKGYSYIVPKNQRQRKVIEAIFEKRTSFTDSLFYDVSAWNFPLAFNLNFNENASSHMGPEITDLRPRNPKKVSNSQYAYLMEWHEYYTPKALYQLLSKGIRVKVGMKPFSLEGKKYDYGTLLIPVQNQRAHQEELHQLLQTVSSSNHIDITAVSTGLTQGIDLGSNQFKTLFLPKIALLTGQGITSYDAGEIWHLMDQRYDIPITKLDTEHIQYRDLSKYTHIIMCNTRGTVFDKEMISKLKSWVHAGGNLIGYRNVANFFKNHEFMNIEYNKPEIKATDVTFGERADFYGAKRIGGAIFNAKIDRSHPINFGYTNENIALFKNTTLFIKPTTYGYKNPIQYTSKPLLSGYINKDNLASIKNTVAFRHQNSGKGNVLLFTDNTNFRAFWYGTNKLLMNAIFFGNIM
ncbi:M14 family zinc carboxypeptidase [Aquimarina hainanensis]|uniref:M14 family zinc carboxypeptidase n=1 Tax=Aquimarina hainanensis TaxID=1578017 RepID=A0ABW5N6L5_9FLAO